MRKERKRQPGSDLERKIGDAMNKEASPRTHYLETILAKRSCHGAKLPISVKPPLGVEYVEYVTHRAMTTRILHRGECVRLAGGVKEACSL